MTAEVEMMLNTTVFNKPHNDNNDSSDQSQNQQKKVLVKHRLQPAGSTAGTVGAHISTNKPLDVTDIRHTPNSKHDPNQNNRNQMMQQAMMDVMAQCATKAKQLEEREKKLQMDQAQLARDQAQLAHNQAAFYQFLLSRAGTTNSMPVGLTGPTHQQLHQQQLDATAQQMQMPGVQLQPVGFSAPNAQMQAEQSRQLQLQMQQHQQLQMQHYAWISDPNAMAPVTPRFAPVHVPYAHVALPMNGSKVPSSSETNDHSPPAAAAASASAAK
jgi:hypothetical protein